MNASDTAPRQEDGAPAPVSASALFDEWASAGASRARNSLNPRSINNYRSIWSNWLRWLPPETPWSQASAAQVSAFLQQISPSASARLKQHHISEREASSVTQRRYWRVLRDIYRHAFISRWCQTNPCEADSDVSQSEAMDSMILPSWALRQLEAGIVRAHTTREASTWQQLRNDALLLVLLHSGAKTGEIAALRVDQLLPLQTQQHQPHWGVNIDGGRASQNRHIVLPADPTGPVLDKWLHTRRQLERCPPWLFFGAKSHLVEGRRERTALTNKSIFLCISEAVKTHLPADAFESFLAHVGGETIRNSVLARWLEEGVAPEEVSRRAGLSASRHVTRLDRQSDHAPV